MSWNLTQCHSSNKKRPADTRMCQKRYAPVSQEFRLRFFLASPAFLFIFALNSAPGGAGPLSMCLGPAAPPLSSAESSLSSSSDEPASSFFILPLPLLASDPFFTPTFRPCLLRAFSRALEARIPWKSFAVKTLKTSVITLATVPWIAPCCMLKGSIRRSFMCKR